MISTLVSCRNVPLSEKYPKHFWVLYSKVQCLMKTIRTRYQQLAQKCISIVHTVLVQNVAKWSLYIFTNIARVITMT